ncbi:MAG: DUF1573 domain-containing protein [Candidatus Zixiibacteriota bacterium]|nr:MAG: DUF1573 domain-containing protein [candidate division Zixibacteria bacterium]
MRKSLITSVAIVVMALSVPLQGEDFEWEAYDFGHVAIDFDIFHTYAYVNNTDRPLKILEAEANCDCTTIRLLDSLLDPGDTAFIELTFNTRDYYGPTSKSFTVVTDNTELPKMKYFYLSTIGQWFHGMKPNPMSLFFLPGKKSQKVLIPNRAFDRIRINQVEQYDSTFVVKAAIESADKSDFLVLEVSPADNLSKGTFLSSFTVEIELAGEEKPAVLTFPVKIVRY